MCLTNIKKEKKKKELNANQLLYYQSYMNILVRITNIYISTNTTRSHRKKKASITRKDNTIQERSQHLLAKELKNVSEKTTANLPSSDVLRKNL